MGVFSSGRGIVIDFNNRLSVMRFCFLDAKTLRDVSRDIESNTNPAAQFERTSAIDRLAVHRFHSSRESIEWTWVFFVLATTLDSRQTIEQARSASFRLHRESDVISDVPFLELLDSAAGCCWLSKSIRRGCFPNWRRWIAKKSPNAGKNRLAV